MSAEVGLARLFDGKTVRTPSEFLEYSVSIVRRFPFDPHLRQAVVELYQIIHKERTR